MAWHDQKEHGEAAEGCQSMGNCPVIFPADCGIMCACIGGCNGSLTNFGAASTASIIAFRDGRNCLHAWANVVYVQWNFVGNEFGTMAAPYNTIREGAWGVNPGGTVRIRGGTYNEGGVLRNLDRPMLLEVWPGAGSVLLQ